MSIPNRCWRLVDIYRTNGLARCGQCNAQLRYVFTLTRGTQTMNACDRCVSRLIRGCDPKIALRVLTGRWRVRGRYRYRQINGAVWSIGQMKSSDWWWVRLSLKVASPDCHWVGKYPTLTAAKVAVAIDASGAA